MDIKPPNFITVCGQMKVIDLGCAEEIPEGKECVMCRMSKGTEGYMGPEYIPYISYSKTSQLGIGLAKPPVVCS